MEITKAIFTLNGKNGWQNINIFCPIKNGHQLNKVAYYSFRSWLTYKNEVVSHFLVFITSKSLGTENSFFEFREGISIWG